MPSHDPTKIDVAALLKSAEAVLPHAYAPYSKFRVGAALLADDGTVFHGVNVENASYGLTVCAERSALFRAVSEGHKTLRAIAITCSGIEPPLPCGACRQVLHEFAPTLVVVCAGQQTGHKTSPVQTTLDALLPMAFKL